MAVIGVMANPADHAVVREFFQLFKTPWEFCQDGRRYDAILCDRDYGPGARNAELVLIYAGEKLRAGGENSRHPQRFLLHKGRRIPIYGSSEVFEGQEAGDLLEENSRRPALRMEGHSRPRVVRIGYDLLGEIRFLLTSGQTAENAQIPALELHISLLRDVLVKSGIRFLEIPPVPEGFSFVACLTHDVDHPAIRRHKFDHTMWGVLWRAVFGSVARMLRGRLGARGLLRNWAAALRLPLVHLGLAGDFWTEFLRYPELELGGRSSFFFLPVKHHPGRTPSGQAPSRRASPYAAAEIAEQLQALLAAGCEVGLHGIDAWLDTASAREELEQIRRIGGKRDVGVRMHWLYFDAMSPRRLEEAGAAYDSTVGFNETVGYRAGTAQVYQPLEAARLLELPLHVMDTALFYPSHLDLSPGEARKLVGRMIGNALEFGGVITVNWHDRSLAPERLWGDFYAEMVADFRKEGAWLACAAETVAWFRKRRSVAWENVSVDSEAWERVRKVDSTDDLPALRVEVHNAREAQPVGSKP